jgi:hypothetical protein
MNAREPKRFLGRKSYRKLLRFAVVFTESLRHESEFANAISADVRAFRADLLRAIKAQFRLRTGRHGDLHLDAACELVKKGQSVPEVLRSQITGWDTLDPYARYLASKGLRQAVARRKRRQKQPQKQRRKVTTKSLLSNREDK